jgi:hypothetical protein
MGRASPDETIELQECSGLDDHLGRPSQAVELLQASWFNHLSGELLSIEHELEGCYAGRRDAPVRSQISLWVVWLQRIVRPDVPDPLMWMMASGAERA